MKVYKIHSEKKHILLSDTFNPVKHHVQVLRRWEYDKIYSKIERFCKENYAGAQK